MRRGILAALPLLVWGHATLAQQIDTGCQYETFANSYFLRDGQQVFDDGRHTAFVLKLETPLYKASTGEEMVAGRKLAFSQRVYISDPGKDSDRLEVRDVARNEKFGWANKTDLLCRAVPLNADGLYRRAVVRTEPAEKGQVKPKKAYHGPNRQCEGGEQRCLEVTRMQWYYVYGEDGDNLLLSEYSRLDEANARLFGWLPKPDAISWNTALGLRPSLELAARPGPNGASESHICAFKTREDARGTDTTKCNPVLGGKIWFKKESRILILREDAEGYDVAFTSAASADRDYGRLLAPVRNVDVFFVIDGTKSMDPVIAGVKETVTKLMSTVQGHVQKGAGLRFGFRVYRDSVRGGPDGVQNSQKLALDPDKCTTGNQDEFQRAFAPVKAEDPDNDLDYMENSFAGILQAAEDMAGCPDNVKLVFVIGDHGYDPAAQAARNHKSYTVANVAARFKKDASDPNRHNPRFTSPPLVYFLQTPSKCEGPTCKQAEYDIAYATFKRQALEILTATYEGLKSDLFKRPDEFFVPLRTEDISREVVERVGRHVGTYLQPGALEELRSRLSAGQSLVDAIKALQQESNLDIPIAWSQFVEEALCQRLGDQCRTKVIQAVNEGFIPRRHDPDIEKELLVSKDQLGTWLKVLEKFQQSLSGGVSTRERQNQVVNALLQGLESVLRTDFRSGVSLMERARMQASLPNAGRSPLLQYSPDELRSEQFSLCELEYLSGYGSKRYDILHIVEDGLTLAKFRDRTPPPPATCAGALSEKGKRVPFIEGRPLPERINPPGGESEYKLTHERGGETWYWLPVRYMP